MNINKIIFPILSFSIYKLLENHVIYGFLSLFGSLYVKSDIIMSST